MAQTKPPCSCSRPNSRRQGDALGSGTSLLCIALATQVPATNEASLRHATQQAVRADYSRWLLIGALSTQAGFHCPDLEPPAMHPLPIAPGTPRELQPGHLAGAFTTL